LIGANMQRCIGFKLGGMKVKKNKKAWHPTQGDQAFLFEVEPLPAAPVTTENEAGRLEPWNPVMMRFVAMQDSG